MDLNPAGEGSGSACGSFLEANRVFALKTPPRLLGGFWAPFGGVELGIANTLDLEGAREGEDETTLDAVASRRLGEEVGVLPNCLSA